MKHGVIAVIFLFVVSVPAGMAANPASTAYVDKKIALAKESLVTLINSKSSVGPHVGSCYGGGVVFYVNTTPGAPVGQRGLIAALGDATSGCTGSPSGTCYWDTLGGNTSTFGATGQTYFSGSTNTTNIITAIGTTRAEAANAANTYTDGTYYDWYLPSQGELAAMFFQALTNGTGSFWTNCSGTAPSKDLYWSSTQTNQGIGPNGAWFTYFNTIYAGTVGYVATNNPFGVRAVRAF